MRNAFELINMGKELSTDYVSKGKDMSEGLRKFAESKRLNQQEASRVAETANVETYLALIKTADDKYIKFPLADTNIINVPIEKIATEHINSDEYKDITKDFSFLQYSNITESDITDIPHTSNQSQLRKYASRLDGTLKYVENCMYDELVDTYHTVNSINHIVKQAVLQNIPFETCSDIIKIAAPEIADVLKESMLSDMCPKMPTIDFTKEATHIDDERVSGLGDLVKELLNKYKYMSKIAEAYDEYLDEYNKLVSKHKLGITKEAKMFNSVRKHPVLATGLALTLGFGVGHVATKLGTPKPGKLDKYTAAMAMMNKKS